MNLQDLVLELERRTKEGGCLKKFFVTEEDRTAYPHWMQFFLAGKDHKERLALCANQVGA